jgi:hypothetical protein
MADQSLQHDTAVSMARALVEIIAPCLRQEEQLEAFREFYDVVLAGLEAYEAQVGLRRGQAAEPSPN